MNKELIKRFDDLRNKVPFSESTMKELDSLYTQSHRYYHGWSHINDCLKEFEWIKHKLKDPLAVELSIWFHDCYYKVGAKDNEQKSAEMAFDYIKEYDKNLALKVQAFVCDTNYAEGESLCDHDLDYLKDIDFSSFGKPFDLFWLDVENLIKEASLVMSEKEAVEKCTQFYSLILGGEYTLFRTEDFKAVKYEPAKANIKKALNRFENEKV